MSKAKKGKYISYLLRFAVAAAALYLAFRGEDLGAVAKVLLGLNLWVFAAGLGTYIIGQLIFVARWYMLLRVQSIDIGYWPAVRLHFLGLFYNNCLPGSVGGDVLRAWYVTKHTDKKLEAALSVFVDRAVGLTGIAVMAFFCYWFVPAQGRLEQFGAKLSGGGFFHRLIEHKWIAVATAAALVITVVVLMVNEKGRGFLYKVFRLIREHGAAMLRKANIAIRIYYSKKLALFWALLLTFACQGICIVGMWLIGREIGVTVHAKYYFIFFPISWLLGTLPISVGGAGIMELWLKEAFMQVGAVSSNQAIVLAFCQRLIWLFGSLPGVVIHLVGAHLPKDFFIDYNKSMN
jgi:uncharacterized protein (TIRG00374 family)